jgi:hypothetical protein
VWPSRPSPQSRTPRARKTARGRRRRRGQSVAASALRPFGTRPGAGRPAPSAPPRRFASTSNPPESSRIRPRPDSVSSVSASPDPGPLVGLSIAFSYVTSSAP